MAGNMEANVKINVVANTQQFDSQMQSSMINAAKHGAITDNGLASIPGEKANGNLSTLNETFTTFNDVMNQVISNFKVFSENLKKTNGVGNSGFGSNDVSGDNSIFKSPTIQKGISSVVGVAGTGLAMYQGYNAYERQMMHGNWLDAKVTGVNTASNAVSGIGSALTMAGLASGMVPLALIGGVMQLGGLAARGYSSYLEKKNDEYKMLSENFPIFDQLLIGDNKTISNNWQDNARAGHSSYNLAIKKNMGTGLADDEFINIVTNFMNKGNSLFNSSTGADKVVEAANLARSTNGDVSSIADTMAYLSRFKGVTDNTLQSAFNNTKNLGFSDVQFNELMAGIRTNMERGVSKGFVSSSTALMQTLSSFNSASNGSVFWSGQEGLKRVQTFSEAMSNSQNLESVEDVAMYKAAQDLGMENIRAAIGESSTGNDIIDTMTYLEQGNVSPEFLNAYNNRLKGYYGNDPLALYTAFKNKGFSSTSAAEYYKMMKNDNFKFSSNISNVDRNIGFESATTAEQDMINQLTRKVTVGDNDSFSEALEKIADNKVFSVSVVDEMSNTTKANTTIGRLNLTTLNTDDDEWLSELFNSAANDSRVSQEEYEKLLKKADSNIISYDGNNGYSFSEDLKGILEEMLREMRAGIYIES